MLPAPHLPLNIPFQPLVSEYLDIVIEAEYETTDAEVAHHLGGEDPMVGTVGRKTGSRLRIFLQHEIAGKLPEAEFDGIFLLAAEHKQVGEDLLMRTFVLPLAVKNHHFAHTRNLECLTHAAGRFVAAHVIVVIHEEKRFPQCGR